MPFSCPLFCLCPRPRRFFCPLTFVPFDLRLCLLWYLRPRFGFVLGCLRLFGSPFRLCLRFLTAFVWRSCVYLAFCFCVAFGFLPLPFVFAFRLFPPGFPLAFVSCLCLSRCRFLSLFYCAFTFGSYLCLRLLLSPFSFAPAFAWAFALALCAYIFLFSSRLPLSPALPLSFPLPHAFTLPFNFSPASASVFAVPFVPALFARPLSLRLPRLCLLNLSFWLYSCLYFCVLAFALFAFAFACGLAPLRICLRFLPPLPLPLPLL